MIFTESVRSATHLANQGDFLSAIETLGDRWRGIGVEPAREDESDLEHAQLLLVCGILTVKLGKFAARSQSDAKDLLSKSIRLFGEDAGRYEAVFWLATAYSFCGEHGEALTLVDSILADQKADLDTEFSASILKGYTHLGLGSTTAAEESFTRVEVFLGAVSPLCRGKFHLTRGMLFRQTNRFDEALADYDLAFGAFALANSPRYQAAVRNNMARVFIEQGRLLEARASAEYALAVFTELRDRAHEAKAWDELARIYEREENFPEMVRCSDRAVDLLSAGDHEGWLAEALITQGTAHARLGLLEGLGSLDRALEICARLNDPKQAEAVTEAMCEVYRRGRNSREAIQADMSGLERTVFGRVLEKHRGRVSPAAHQLGLHHEYFQRQLAMRYPELLRKRAPRVRRHKSLMRRS